MALTGQSYLILLSLCTHPYSPALSHVPSRPLTRWCVHMVSFNHIISKHLFNIHLHNKSNIYKKVSCKHPWSVLVVVFPFFCFHFAMTESVLPDLTWMGLSNMGGTSSILVLDVLYTSITWYNSYTTYYPQPFKIRSFLPYFTCTLDVWSHLTGSLLLSKLGAFL